MAKKGQGAQSGQEKLAESLISSLGIKGAVSACQANAWDGVLALVLERNPAVPDEARTGAETRAPNGASFHSDPIPES